jgi:hypothetical protein
MSGGRRQGSASPSEARHCSLLLLKLHSFLNLIYILQLPFWKQYPKPHGVQNKPSGFLFHPVLSVTSATCSSYKPLSYPYSLHSRGRYNCPPSGAATGPKAGLISAILVWKVTPMSTIQPSQGAPRGPHSYYCGGVTSCRLGNNRIRARR